jgi:hypothetical protein
MRFVRSAQEVIKQQHIAGRVGVKLYPARFKGLDVGDLGQRLD